MRRTDRQALIEAYGMINSLVVLTAGKLKKGRLKRFIKKLEKQVLQGMRTVQPVQDHEIETFSNKLDKFMEASGWEGKGLSMPLVVSFCLLIAEAYNMPNALIDTLLAIFDYYDRAQAASNLESRNAAYFVRLWEQA